jgi:DNA-binding IclR family transcriptional regulator
MPAKNQRRRTVSFRPSVFARAKAHAASLGMPLAAWMEHAVTEALDADGALHPPTEPHTPKRNVAGIRNRLPACTEF